MAKKRYLLNPAPFVVPTTDGKLIEEHVGLATLIGSIVGLKAVAP